MGVGCGVPSLNGSLGRFFKHNLTSRTPLELQQASYIGKKDLIQWGGSVSASLFSGLKQTGRDELLETLADWLGQKKAGSEATGDNAFVKAPAQGGEAGDMTSVV